MLDECNQFNHFFVMSSFSADSVAVQLTRQSSVAYLASFLARASYMEASTVSAALGVLLQWAQNYLDQNADSVAFVVPHTPRSKVGRGFEM